MTIAKDDGFPSLNKRSTIHRPGKTVNLCCSLRLSLQLLVHELSHGTGELFPALLLSYRTFTTFVRFGAYAKLILPDGAFWISNKVRTIGAGIR
jgi:hypothetical protein